MKKKQADWIIHENWLKNTITFSLLIFKHFFKMMMNTKDFYMIKKNREKRNENNRWIYIESYKSYKWTVHNYIRICAHETFHPIARMKFDVGSESQIDQNTWSVWRYPHQSGWKMLSSVHSGGPPPVPRRFSALPFW